MAVTVRVVLFLSLFSTLMGHVDGSSPITASTEEKPMSNPEEAFDDFIRKWVDRPPRIRRPTHTQGAVT